MCPELSVRDKPAENQLKTTEEDSTTLNNQVSILLKTSSLQDLTSTAEKKSLIVDLLIDTQINLHKMIIWLTVETRRQITLRRN